MTPRIRAVLATVCIAAAGLFAASMASCSLVLNFDGELVDGSLPPDAPVPDADPFAPDAPPDPRTVLEPNDTLLDAVLITPGVYGPMAVHPLGDHDFFKFDLAALADVTVAIDFVSNQGDLDLRLYDPSGMKIGESATVMDQESISKTTAMGGQIGPGTYTIEAYGFNNMRINESYTLTLTVVEAVPPSDAGP